MEKKETEIQYLAERLQQCKDTLWTIREGLYELRENERENLDREIIMSMLANLAEQITSTAFCIYDLKQVNRMFLHAELANF